MFELDSLFCFLFLRWLNSHDLLPTSHHISYLCIIWGQRLQGSFESRPPLLITALTRKPALQNYASILHKHMNSILIILRQMTFKSHVITKCCCLYYYISRYRRKLSWFRAWRKRQTSFVQKLTSLSMLTSENPKSVSWVETIIRYYKTFIWQDIDFLVFSSDGGFMFKTSSHPYLI